MNKYFSVIKEIYKSYNVAKDFSRCAKDSRIVSVSEGNVKVELDIREEHLNPVGTLHGGCTATLVDIVTTTALMATEKGQPGVSVDLTVSYLAGAKFGETVIIDGTVLKNGRNMAFTQAKIFRKSDNALLAIAQHTKAFPRKS